VERRSARAEGPDLTGRDFQFIAIGVMISGLALVLVGVIGYLLGQ